MQIKSVARASAIVSSLALLALSGSPAMAAEPVAQAGATGLTLSIANSPASTGTYQVINDGTTQTATGSNQPALSLLGNQTLISAGTLAQNATTAIVNGDGTSAACAGVAGQGASLVAAGQGNCLSGGNALNLTTAQLDLNQIAATTLVPGQTFTSLNGLLTQLNLLGATQPLIDALQSGLDQALAPLAGSGLIVSAGAIQSSCTATPTTADGTANIANAGAFVQLPAFAGQPAQRIDLLNFPANPAPNTNVLVNLDGVSQAIISGLTTSLNTSAGSALNQVPGIGQILTTLGVTLQGVQDQLVINLVAQLQPVLAPLNANVLEGTLNKQVRPATNSIEVTALELKVLPVLQQQLGYSLLETAIGKSTCGPNGRVAAAPAATQAPAPNNNPGPNNNNPGPRPNPQVPTSVPAGIADGPLQNAPLGPWALAGLGALLVASAGAGTAAYRRSSARV